MGNDAICKTTRIGSINLKMFDRKARLNKYETHFGVEEEFDFSRSIRCCRKQIFTWWHNWQSDKGLQVSSKTMTHRYNIVTDGSSIGTIKNPTSILKFLRRSSRNPWTFKYSRIESGTLPQVEVAKVEKGERDLKGVRDIKVWLRACFEYKPRWSFLENGLHSVLRRGSKNNNMVGSMKVRICKFTILCSLTHGEIKAMFKSSWRLQKLAYM